MREKLTTLRQRPGVKSVLASLISILIGLLVGSLLILIMSLFNPSLGLRGAWEGIRLVLFGILSTGREAGALTWGFNAANVGNMLFRATPLVLTGLSVAVAYKTGLFNIGASGQYLMGTAATLLIALGFPTTVIPAPLLWLLAFLGGVLAGALWGCIPGLVKALLNINEVLACIMTNWIAANAVTWIFDSSRRYQNLVEGTKTAYVYKTTYGLQYVPAGTGLEGSNYTYVDGAGIQTAKLGLDKLFPGSQVNGGILIAALIAVGIYILMTRTTLGYQLKACGANRHAARYAGINDKRNIVLSMAIAGGLSGAAASLYYLSGNTEFYWQTYQSLPAEGFNGIPVALLAVCNPIAVIFTGIFMSMLNVVGQQLKSLTAFNEYITNVIISVIVYLSAFSLMIRMFLERKSKRGGGNANAEPAPAPAAVPVPPDTPPADGSNGEGGEQA